MPQFLQIYGLLAPTLRGFTLLLLFLAAAVLSLLTANLGDHYGRLDFAMAGAFVLDAGRSEKTARLVDVCYSLNETYLAVVKAFILGNSTECNSTIYAVFYSTT